MQQYGGGGTWSIHCTEKMEMMASMSVVSVRKGHCKRLLSADTSTAVVPSFMSASVTCQIDSPRPPKPLFGGLASQCWTVSCLGQIAFFPAPPPPPGGGGECCHTCSLAALKQSQSWICESIDLRICLLVRPSFCLYVCPSVGLP
jgi:hypothetical protein